MIEILGNILTISSDIFATLISLIINTLSFSLNLCHIIGQLIVKSIVTVVSLALDCVSALKTLLEVLAEDSVVFLSDLGTTLSFLFKGIFVFGDAFIHALVGVSSTFGHVVKAGLSIDIYIFSGFVNFASSILCSIHHCLTLIKNSLVLVGLTTWDLFVFIPNILMYVEEEFLSIVIQGMGGLRDVIRGLKLQLNNGFQGLVLFISDIPRESLYGLILCCAVLFLCIKYHHSIRPLIIRNIVYLLTQGQKILITAWTYVEAFTFWLLTNQMTPSLHGPRHFTADRAPNVDQLRETPSREENLNVSADQFERKVPQEPEDRLCVVCQDSEKCTIILPCRHVCLCYECCSTIKRTHGKCPICRHVVRRTMRVYI